MKTKPKVGQRLRLLAWAQKSRAGFSVPVVCVQANDTRDTLAASLRPLARQCQVLVKLADGADVWVTRDDLEPEDT